MTTSVHHLKLQLHRQVAEECRHLQVEGCQVAEEAKEAAPWAGTSPVGDSPPLGEPKLEGDSALSVGDSG